MENYEELLPRAAERESEALLSPIRTTSARL